MKCLNPICPREGEPLFCPACDAERDHAEAVERLETAPRDGVLLASGGLVIVRTTRIGEVFLYVSDSAMEPGEGLTLLEDDDGATFLTADEASALGRRLLDAAAVLRGRPKG